MRDFEFLHIKHIEHRIMKKKNLIGDHENYQWRLKFLRIINNENEEDPTTYTKFCVTGTELHYILLLLLINIKLSNFSICYENIKLVLMEIYIMLLIIWMNFA